MAVPYYYSYIYYIIRNMDIIKINIDQCYAQHSVPTGVALTEWSLSGGTPSGHSVVIHRVATRWPPGGHPVANPPVGLWCHQGGWPPSGFPVGATRWPLGGPFKLTVYVKHKYS